MTSVPFHQPPVVGGTLVGAFAGNPLFQKALLVITGSLFIALSAQLAIRLPFSPVPITGQTFAVLIVGMAFGARLGAITALAYVLEGFFWPVFAEARTWAHPLTLWTAGYLVGFVAAAWVTGWLAEQGWDRKPTTTALAMILGSVAIYIPGVIWLAFMYAYVDGLNPTESITKALYLGFVVFLAGDAIKLALAVLAFPLAWRWVNRHL